MAFDWLSVPTKAIQIIEPPTVTSCGDLPSVNSHGDLLW